jgi:putative glutamine amidotransferase
VRGAAEQEEQVPRRPLIGIATQTLQPIPGQVPLAWVMGQKYVRVLTSLGAVPWLVPLLPDDEATLREVYDRLDGVFVTGGVDVDPSRYGEERLPVCGASDADRDATELLLLRWAVADHKPVLGVCRGHQVLNVALGGTLYQDVTAQRPQAIRHDYFPVPGSPHTRDELTHDVELDRSTRLAGILGADRLRVNSMHHQGVKTLAPGLVASAFAPDGLIEGIEGTNGRFLVGVQWHPEELADRDPAMRRLFTAFLEAASGK